MMPTDENDFGELSHIELLEKLDELESQRDFLLQNLKTTHAIGIHTHNAFGGLDEIESNLYTVKQELQSRAFDRDGPEDPTRLFLPDDIKTVNLDDYR